MILPSPVLAISDIGVAMMLRTPRFLVGFSDVRELPFADIINHEGINCLYGVMLEDWHHNETSMA